MRLSSLTKAAIAVGLPESGIARLLNDFFSQHPDSMQICSHRILQDGCASWPQHLMDFVDHFRRDPHPCLIKDPPAESLAEPLKCLLASTAERLCALEGIDPPTWCGAIEGLKRPWFVSGVENLKAIALVESPTEFRKRNLFVLGNFLERA